MAGLNHEQLQQDLARTMARGLVRSGVKLLLDSNALGGEQLSACPQCSGEALLTVEDPPASLPPLSAESDILRAFAAAGEGVCLSYTDVMRCATTQSDGEEILLGLRQMVREGRLAVHKNEGTFAVTYELVRERDPFVADPHDDAALGRELYGITCSVRFPERETRGWDALDGKGKDEYIEIAAEFQALLRGLYIGDADARALHEQANAAESGWLEADRLRKQAERTLGHVCAIIGLDVDQVGDVPTAVRNALAEAETRGRAKLVAEMNKLVTEEREQ